MIRERGVNYEQILNLRLSLLTEVKSCDILAINNGRGALCQEYAALNGSSQELKRGKKGRVPRFVEAEDMPGRQIISVVLSQLRCGELSYIESSFTVFRNRRRRVVW